MLLIKFCAGEKFLAPSRILNFVGTTFQSIQSEENTAKSRKSRKPLWLLLMLVILLNLEYLVISAGPRNHKLIC